jgi:16S rRNA processing protein RimM
LKGAPDWILVGLVKRIHGKDGEMLISQLTDRDDLFAAGAVLTLVRKREEERTPVKIETSRMSDRGPLIRLEGIHSKDEAQPFFGASLFIPAGELEELEEGAYYAFQIEGCEVYEGERLVGTVSRFMDSPKANPYLEIEPLEEGQLFFIPFIKQAILSFDVDGRRIDIAEGFVV